MSQLPTAPFPVGLFGFPLPISSSEDQWVVIALVAANHLLALCDQVLFIVQLTVPWW